MKGGIGVLVINISVALYLAATGIMGFTKDGLLANKPEIRQAIEALLKKSDFREVLIVVLSVIALLAGLLIIARLFNIPIPMVDLLLIIVSIVWVVFIIMIDIVAPLDSSRKVNFLDWLLRFSSHLLVLGGIAMSTERFGGR